MKKVGLSCLLVVWGCFFFVQAQDIPDWEFQFPGAVKWELSDEVFQINYNYNEETLTAFDYREQKVLWSQSIPGLDKAKIHIVPGHPFLRFDEASFSEKKRKGTRMVIVDRFTGATLFDAEWTDFENIKESYFLANAGMVLLKGKERKENMMALAELGNKDLKWRREMPASKDDFKGLNKLLFENKFDMGPIANKHRLVFAYADILFALDTENGSVAWERPVKETNIAYITIRENDPDPDIFYVIEKPGDNWAMNAYHMKDCAVAWKEPYLFFGYHHIQYGVEEILIWMGNTFNYIDYAGNPKWLNPPQFSYPIEKLYLQDDEYLIWMVNIEAIEKDNQRIFDTTYLVNWLDDTRQIQFEQPVAVMGKYLRMGKRLGNRLVLVTDKEIAVIDMLKGKRITGEMSCENCLYMLDTMENQIVFYTGSQLIGLNYADGSWKRIAEEVKWEKNEQPQALKILPSGYSLISGHQLLVYSHDGNLAFEKYYPEKAAFNPIKIIGAIATVGAGIVFRKEMAAINRAAYETELIDSEEYMNNAMAMAAYKGVGSALVGSSFAGRLMSGNGEEGQEQAVQRFENLWLVSDKIDDGQFGLRVFDLSSLKEEKTIWLAKNEDFGFWIEPRLGGIMRFVGGKLMFYRL